MVITNNYNHVQLLILFFLIILRLLIVHVNATFVHKLISVAIQRKKLGWAETSIINRQYLGVSKMLNSTINPVWYAQIVVYWSGIFLKIQQYQLFSGAKLFKYLTEQTLHNFIAQIRTGIPSVVSLQAVATSKTEILCAELCMTTPNDLYIKQKEKFTKISLSFKERMLDVERRK